MQTSRPDPHALVDELARVHGFTPSGVHAMRDALVRGDNRMAQFDHPDFGGAGQWMQGGMLMTADPFDHALKRRIGALCEDLASRLDRDPDRDAPASGSPFTETAGFQRQSQTSGGAAHVQDARDLPSGGGDMRFASRASSSWWPASLGRPESTGSQDDMRYAYFAGPRRLAIESGGRMTLYDTDDHRISGVSQQQGGRGTLAFTSQHGPVAIDALRVVDAATNEASDASPIASLEPPSGASPVASLLSRRAPAADPHDPFTALERLSDLHRRGVISDAEFAAKKAELLDRI